MANPNTKASTPNTPGIPDTSGGWSKAGLNAKVTAGKTTPSVQRLMDLGQALVTNQKWLPHDGMTFCNCAVALAAKTYGYSGFYDSGTQPLMANSIISKMASDTDHWKSVTAAEAWDNALSGGLSIACYSEAPHGHVAVIAPGPRVWSDKFQGYCPPVFNVGKTMNTQPPYTIGENFAFLYKPNHYAYLPSL